MRSEAVEDRVFEITYCNLVFDLPNMPHLFWLWDLLGPMCKFPTYMYFQAMAWTPSLLITDIIEYQSSLI